MPLIDSPPDALARVYAISLFEMAAAGGGRARLEDLAGEIDELVELTRANPDLSEFFASRILPMKQRQASIQRIFAGRISPLLLNFLQVLNRKERLSSLLPIAGAFDEMIQERFGRVEVDLYTPVQPEASLLSSVGSRLESALKRTVVMHGYADPTIIGGVKIQIGDKLIDASVATQLHRMRRRLTDEGGAAMRSRFDQAFED